MQATYRFFNNCDCAYFPCHQGVAAEEFNCLFCFCPLYFFADCGGTPRYTPEGVKDCSQCVKPHLPEAYDAIVCALGQAHRHYKGLPPLRLYKTKNEDVGQE